MRPDRRAGIAAAARSLMALWPRSAACYYDEVDDCFHYHHPDSLLEIATAWLDNTIYYLRFVDECLHIEVRRLDNYKRHLTAKFVDAEMDDEDWAMLAGILARLVQTARSREQLGKIALEPVWERLLSALFPSPDWGRRPTRCPCRKTDSYAQGAALCAVLEKSHRYAAWEWKEWHDAGVASLNKLAPLRQRQIRIPYPVAAEQAVVFASDDFGAAVLDWFECRLSPLGLSLIAISPFDEMQGFALVPTSTLGVLTEALSSLCIEYRWAAPRPT